MRFKTYFAAIMAAVLVAGCDQASGPDGVDQLNFDAAVVAADGAVEDLEMMHGPGLGKQGGVFPGLIGGRPDCPKTQDVFLCDPIERDGITYTRTIVYKDALGNPQDGYVEGETASIEYEIWVEGERGRMGWGATIERHRTMVVEGLLEGDGDVTWNGSGEGSVTRSRHFDDGTERTYNMTSTGQIINVVVPYPREDHSWPTSGTITRTMTITRTWNGSEQTVSRTVEITFNGTSEVSVGVDGETFTLDLSQRPFGPGHMRGKGGGRFGQPGMP
jgi:hypothetical protein